MNKYPKAMIWLHWITFTVLALGLIAVLLRELIDVKTQKLLLLNLHRSIEIWIPFVVLARLLIKIKHIENHPDHEFHPLMQLGINLVHIAFYGCLVIIPVLGVMQTQASGHNVSMAFITLPNFIAPDMDYAETLADYHEWLAWSMLSLVGLHILASFYHHFIKKDNVLNSMLPININLRK